MYGNDDNIQRFVSLADIYFRLTGKSAGTMSGSEMEILYTLATKCSSPNEFHKLVKSRIKTEDATPHYSAIKNMDRWHMLPPEQRIM